MITVYILQLRFSSDCINFGNNLEPRKTRQIFPIMEIIYKIMQINEDQILFDEID